MFWEILFQSALYLPLILGIFLSFKILRLTDLTADGSFVLGAGIYARLLIENWPQAVCIIAAIIGGGIVGLILSLIQKNNRVPSILASILCVFMLQSVNISVMGRPNITLLGQENFLENMILAYPVYSEVLGWGGLILLILGFIKIIESKKGLIARAFGMNDQLLKKQGYNPEVVRKIGLMSSNMLYAFSGVLCAQVQKFSDISMGMGVSLIGIGAVIMGGQLVSLGTNLFRQFIKRKKWESSISQGFQANTQVIGCLIGIIGYFLLTRFFLSLGIDPSLIKLFVGIVLTVLFTFNIGPMIYDRNTAR